MLSEASHYVDPGRLIWREHGRTSDSVAEDRDFEGTTILIVKRVAELGLPERQRVDLSLAINFRFMAFNRLVADDGGRGWTWKGDEQGCTQVHEELIRAAAEEPMIEIEDEVHFDPDSFQRRLLSLAETQGEA